MFEAILDHKFPFQQPQIVCMTAFSQPPLNDGRDLFNDIVKPEDGGWKIARKLFEIVKFIPDFISDVIEELSSDCDKRVWGTFNVGYIYNIDATWNPSQIYYGCEEQDTKDEQIYYPRTLVVTPMALLIFEKNRKHKNLGVLSSWYALSDL